MRYFLDLLPHHVRDRPVGQALDLVRKVELEPLGEVGGEGRDDDLVVGTVQVQLVLDGRTEMPLEPFSPARFA